MSSKRAFILAAALAAAFPPPAAHAQTIDAKAQVCAACHGQNGVPPDPSWPVIWGQDEGYLIVELRDFKTGARKNPIMQGIAASLETNDMLALAHYFSQKPWPNLAQPAASAADTARAQTAANSVVCTSCHQASYLGSGTTPRLAGQHKAYLRQTMLDFRTGARANNPGMTGLMKAISEDDITALAAYLAGM